MNKIKIKNSALNGILGSVAFMAIIFVFILWPKINNIKNISDLTLEQKNQLELRYQKSQNLKNVLNNLKTIKQNEAEINNTHIKAGEELKFITAIEKIASDKNLKEHINLSTTEKNPKKIQNLEINLNLEGNFTDVLQALDQIERMNYYVNFEKLNFYATADSSIGLLPDSPLPQNQTGVSLIGSVPFTL